MGTGGQKNPKVLRTSFMNGPIEACTEHAAMPSGQFPFLLLRCFGRLPSFYHHMHHSLLQSVLWNMTRLGNFLKANSDGPTVTGWKLIATIALKVVFLNRWHSQHVEFINLFIQCQIENIWPYDKKHNLLISATGAVGISCGYVLKLIWRSIFGSKMYLTGVR